jgi:predicted nucleic acid-binding protein
MNLPNEVFVDTSFFIALLNSKDKFHQKATNLQEILSANKTKKLTSEYVLLEVGDGLSNLRFRHLAVQILDLIYQDNSFEIVPTSSEIFTKALKLFKTRPDKEWGMTDCTSFIIMWDLMIDAALTADYHFQQARFRALLLEP